jgi:hypothetical protein
VQDLGSEAVSLADRQRRLTALADEFLTKAAGLGYTQREALQFIQVRSTQRIGENSDG